MGDQPRTLNDIIAKGIVLVRADMLAKNVWPIWSPIYAQPFIVSAAGSIRDAALPTVPVGTRDIRAEAQVILDRAQCDSDFLRPISRVVGFFSLSMIFLFAYFY